MIERLYTLQGPSGFSTDMFRRLSAERTGDYVRLMGSLSCVSGFSTSSAPPQISRPDDLEAGKNQFSAPSSPRPDFASFLSRYMEE